MSTNHESHLWDLRPEWKLEHARASVKDTLALVRDLVAPETALAAACAADEADAVEEMGLRLKLAAVNLCGAAARLREIEEERRVLARYREQEDLRFEAEAGDRDDLNDLNDGRAAA
jgi:hypothetical protein